MSLANVELYTATALIPQFPFEPKRHILALDLLDQVSYANRSVHDEVRCLEGDRMNHEVVRAQDLSTQVEHELLRRLEHRIVYCFDRFLTANHVQIVVNAIRIKEVLVVLEGGLATLLVPRDREDPQMSCLYRVRSLQLFVCLSLPLVNRWSVEELKSSVALIDVFKLFIESD